MKQHKLLEDKVSKVYFSFLIPTVLGMVSQSLYVMVDVMVVGIGVGSDGLAALNIVMPMFTLYTAIGLLVGVGGATTMSVFIGRGEYEKVPSVFTMCFILNVAEGFILSLVSVLFIKRLAFLLGSNEQMLDMVIAYLLPIAAGGWGFILSSMLQVFVRNDGNPRLVMTAILTANITNMILDCVFVFWCKMGIFGASFATAISPILCCAIMMLHFTRQERQLRFAKRFWDKELFVRVHKNGFGTCLLEFTSGLVIYLFNIVLMRISGELSIAVYAIISNIAYVAKGIFNGIAQAMQPVVSVNYGAGKYKRMNHAQHLAQAVALGFSLLSFAACMLFPKQIIMFFTGDDAEMIAASVPALKLYFTSIAFTGVNTMLMYYFQSIEKAVISTFISAAKGIVFLVIGLAVLTPILDVNGVWLTMTFAEGITMIFAVAFKFISDRKFKLHAETQTV